MEDRKALVRIGALLSGEDPRVLEALERYTTDPAAFAERPFPLLGDDLFLPWYDWTESVTTVLWTVLVVHGHMVVVDWKEDPAYVLRALARMSDGVIETSPDYESMVERYGSVRYGITEYMAGSHMEMFGEWLALSRAVGYELEAGRSPGDDCPFMLVPLEHIDDVRDLAEWLNIGLFVEWWEAEVEYQREVEAMPPRRRTFWDRLVGRPHR